ncbi:MAG: DUF3794 domain-containing protein [Eubacteriales bacterium]|nr:DUF3794 domain-containing protein [Eubacteriales bacterium]MDD4390260.1 DUF3794 domain-containing protein [Eubacteriales bacterium]
MKYEDDGFDPTPYDRILAGIHIPAVMPPEEARTAPEPKEASVAPEQKKQEIIKEPETIAPVELLEETREVEKIEEAQEVPQVVEAVEMEEVAEIEETKEVVEMEDILEDKEARSKEVEEEFIPVEIPMYEQPVSKPGKGVSKPAAKRDEGEAVPIGAAALSETLKFADISERAPVRVYIEEDILVPDVKPDLLSIISMNGTVALKREDLIKVSGEVTINALYTPIDGKSEPICAVVARVPFRTDLGENISPMSTLTVNPEIESIEHKVINERKFKAKITLLLNINEYNDVKVECFSGIKGDEVELLKENVTVTEILYKKTEGIEISEVMPIKEGMPRPRKILRSSISIAPNHKQISPEKAVINASVYCNVLYLAEDISTEELQEGEENSKVPVFFQSKTEFTQFIPLDTGEHRSGSKLSFDIRNLNIDIQEGVEGFENESALKLSGNVETTLEIYRNSDKEIVTDFYHAHKELKCESSPLEIKSFTGSGAADLSVREIFNVPDRQEDIEKVLFSDVRIKGAEISADQNKVTVNGSLEAELLCLASGEKGSVFSLKREIPFRGSIDVPGAKSDMLSEYRIDFRDIWFEKLSSRQAELNANLFVSALLWKSSTCNLISNPCIVKQDDANKAGPSMIVYVSGPNDTLWSIAKKFRTSMYDIAEINQIEKNRPVKSGSKILIVK